MTHVTSRVTLWNSSKDVTRLDVLFSSAAECIMLKECWYSLEPSCGTFIFYSFACFYFFSSSLAFITTDVTVLCPPHLVEFFHQRVPFLLYHLTRQPMKVKRISFLVPYNDDDRLGSLSTNAYGKCLIASEQPFFSHSWHTLLRGTEISHTSCF